MSEENKEQQKLKEIIEQKPETTLVAGFNAWQNKFKRHVNKGEKSIKILAPAPYKMKAERDKIDPVTRKVMYDEEGLEQYKSAKKKDIRKLLWDKLPEFMDDQQKEDKIRNLLSSMRRKGIVVADSSNQQTSSWVLVKSED